MPALITEMIHEIGAHPWTFVAEVVQFVVLMLVIKVVAFGWGERKGVVTNMLAERRAKIAKELEDARLARNEASTAGTRAERIRRLARREAAEVLIAARREAAEESARIVALADEDLADIRSEVEETLDRERRELVGGVDDRLIDVVTAATRRVLDEGFSAAQQRRMIEDAIARSLDGLENVALP
jgi:F-type H+-transporting ATPase subunit b